jgi:hypothetical protein
MRFHERILHRLGWHPHRQYSWDGNTVSVCRLCHPATKGSGHE